MKILLVIIPRQRMTLVVNIINVMKLITIVIAMMVRIGYMLIHLPKTLRKR